MAIRRRLTRGLTSLVRERSASREFARIGERNHDVEARHARQVVDLVLRICELSLASGSSASDATGYGVRSAEALGVPVHIDITSTSVTISQTGSTDEDPVTSMRIVQARRQDFHRVAQLEALVSEIIAGGVDVSAAIDRFAEIARSPRTYRPWVMTVAMAVLGGAMAVILRGGWPEVLAATLVTALVDTVVVILGRRRLSLFFIQAIGAAIATAAAILMMIGREYVPGLSEVSPSLVVAAGIVSLLTGLSLVASSRDALDGFYVTASAGMFEVAVATAGIVVGVMSTLWLGFALGGPAYISTHVIFEGSPLPASLAAGTMAIAIGIGAQVRPRGLAPFFLLGAIAWAVNHYTFPVFGDRVAATGVAALVVGALSQLAHRSWKLPVVALVTAGVVPLLPGLTLYRGLFGILQNVESGGNSAASGLLLSALAMGAAIAIGSSLGAQLTRPISTSLSKPRLARIGLGGRSLWTRTRR